MTTATTGSTTRASNLVVVTCPNCGAKNRVDPEKAKTANPKCGKCGTPLIVPVVSAPPPAGEPVVVTDATFDKEVLQVKGKPVLVDCWAPWCGPCRMLEPTIKQLAAESGGKYLIAKLNTDENPQTASKYDISGIPTMLIFKDGKLVDKLVGLQPKPAIAAKLQSLV
jgi:thioredoxin 2